MSAHDTPDLLCGCAACVAEDLALLASHSDPLATISADLRDDAANGPSFNPLTA